MHTSPAKSFPMLLAGRRTRRATLKQGTGLAVAALDMGGLRARTGAQNSTPVPATDTPFPAAEQTALESVVEYILGEHLTPGIVIGVWVPGRGSWVRAAGTGNLETGAPIATDDKFRIGSLTKTFTSTVVLQLVDDGQLSLDDRLDPYVPDVPNGDRITIRQLLDMTAGIFNYTEDESFTAAYLADPLMPFGAQDVLTIVRDHEPYFPPGEDIHYSDTNYVLLGLVVEQVTGQTLGEAISDRILEPLGLTETSYPTTPEMPLPFAHGYVPDPAATELRDVTRFNPDLAAGAGAMISTLADLRTWAPVLADGTLLSAELQRERLMGRQLIPGNPLLRYGLGVMDFNGFIGHGGEILGYSAWVLHLPEENATIVSLANQPVAAGDAVFGVGSVLFPERFLPPVGSPAAGTPAP